MVLGLLGALAAAVCYGTATVLQTLGVRRLAASERSSLPSRLWEGRLYAVGLALDGLGFLASVAALRTLPLFVVQSAIASSVAVTAVLAVLVLGTHLSRREVGALVMVGLGLLALAVSATAEAAVAVTGVGAWLVLASVVPIGALAALGARPGVRPATASTALAAAAGAAFGGVGVAARVLVLPQPWWHLVLSPIAWALLLFAALGTACFAGALAKGSPTTTAAVTFSVETVLPATIGLVWLGDAVRSGLAGVAALGFAATLAGCVALARYAELPDGTVAVDTSGTG